MSRVDSWRRAHPVAMATAVFLAGAVVASTVWAAWALRSEPASDSAAGSKETDTVIVTTTASPSATTAPLDVTTSSPDVTTSSPDVTSPPAAAPSSGGFVVDFDTPDDFFDQFVFEVDHAFPPSRAVNDHIDEWEGDHDSGCHGPDSSRTINVTSYADYFYWCAPAGPESGHIMTSMNTLGYAIAAFSPDRVFDALRRICWDQNLTDLGGRKWTQMMVVPEAEYQSNHVGDLDDGPPPEPGVITEPEAKADNPRLGLPALGYSGPGFQDLTGPTTRLIPSLDVWGVRVAVGTVKVMHGDDLIEGSGDDLFRLPVSGNGAPGRAERFTHCAVDNEDGTITLTQERTGEVRTWTALGDFHDGPSRVIFQDDNYDPPKGPPDAGGDVNRFFTWHWDDIEIS